MLFQLESQQGFVAIVDTHKLVLKCYGRKKASEYSKQPWRKIKSEVFQTESPHIKSQSLKQCTVDVRTDQKKKKKETK